MKTIAENINFKLVIKQSTFVTYLFKIKSEPEALTLIERIKNKHADATHCCYAYIIDERERFYDANEPAGTAGKPILNVLLKNKLNYILAIVVRYYGGIKLGYGGLIRAYSKSISEALKATEIIKVIRTAKIKISFPYSLTKEIDYLLKDCLILNREYKIKTTYLVLIPLTLVSNIKKKLSILKEVAINKINNE